MQRIAILVAVVVLHLLLAFPNRIGALGPSAFVRVSAELPLILLVLFASPARLRSLLRPLLVAGFGALIGLKLADMGTYAAFGRPFDPVLDLHLAAAGWDLLRGAVGTPAAVAAAGATLMAYAAALFAADRSLGLLSHAMSDPWGRSVGRFGGRPVGVATAVAAGAAAIALAVALPALPSLDAAGMLRDRAARALAGMNDLNALRREAAVDAFADVPDERLLAGLAGRDVLLVFVESYGRSALEQPPYAATVQPALDAVEAALAGRGYEARSGWLTAPMVGGQSWLAHGSVLSGLWIDDQRRYDSLMASDRRTLVHGFRRAGWRTVAAMPAITMPWPEGGYFGFDTVYAAADLGYRGDPFNWVTMPDQYTLAALQRLEFARPGPDRPGPDRLEAGRRERPPVMAPVMATVALISSHAPWTPIPPVIDWADVGDGSVFGPYAAAGDPPAVVWRDTGRVRTQYARSLDYVLRTLAAFIAEYGRDDLVLVVLGDHQPAPLITGAGASFDVPVHLLSADPDVIDAIAAWGWTAGMRPGAVRPWRMDAFRDRFLAAFTPEAEAVSVLKQSGGSLN